MENIIMFAFRNGCDRIVVGSENVKDATELAFEQCRNMSEPLYLLGEIEWTQEMQDMQEMQMERTIH